MLDVAPATPAQMRAAWRDCPISADAEAHAEIHGGMPRVDVFARVAVGGAALEVSGPVTIQPLVHAALHFAGHGLDAHAFAASAPASSLDASGDVEVNARPSGAVDGRGTLFLAGGSVGSTRVPSAAVAGQFARSPEGEETGRAEVTVRGPGFSSVVTIRIEPKDGARVATLEGDVSVARLEDVGVLRRAATGSASAHATGAVNIETQGVDASITATVANLGAPGATLTSGHVEAHATGTLDAPSVAVAIDGEGLEAAAIRLSALRAEGLVTTVGGLALHNVRLDATGSGEPAHARSALVRVSSDTVTAEAIVVEGLGSTLTATLKASPSAWMAKAKSDGLDLARLATFARAATARGTLALDVDATVRQGSATGRFRVDLEHAAFPGVGDASGRVDVSIHGREASGHATASVEDIGAIDLDSTSVHIGGGSLLAASPWRKAWGTVEFGAHIDVARLAARLPRLAGRIDTIQGALELRGLASRDTDDDATPRVELTAHTKGLVIAGRSASSLPGPTEGADATPGSTGAWRISGIDPVLRMAVDGNTGNTAVQTQIADAAGPLAVLDAQSSAVPYAVLFSDEDPSGALEAMPFDARIAIPARLLASLPAAWGVGRIGGELQANVSWHGLLLRPMIDASASLVGGNADPALLAVPLDLAFGARYDGVKLDANVQATSHDRPVVAASTTLVASAPDVLAGLSDGSIPWTASARATIDRLPLSGISLLDDSQVRGTVSGQISLDGLRSDARSSLSLDFDGLEVGGVRCRSSSVRATIDGRGLEASARLDQTDGFAEGRVQVGAKWGRANFPTLDASQDAEVAVSAKRFRAAFLLPFVSRWVSELDGRIDADVRARVGGAGETVRPEGSVALDAGSFQLASFGGPFHGVSAKLTLSPDGVLRLQDAVARGISGTVRGAASARFAGLSPASIRASLRIPSKDPLPLVFDGVQMGVLAGSFEVSAKQDGVKPALDVVVDVPFAHVELPSGSSSLTVQSLGAIQGVRVGMRAADKFVETPLDGPRENAGDRSDPRRSPVQITTRLLDVRVSRGTDLDVRLEGQPTITIGNETKVLGQIRLPRGTIDVLGKPFAIDHGTVTFVGDDASNPQIILTAGWTAPDLTRVYADFVGPLKTGKVKLRSEPSKSQSEILALILFGTTDAQSGQEQSAQANTMAAAAGGAATQPLNRALGGVDRALQNLGLEGGISTKIDTSQTYPRPEVEVQIARDISLQIAWVLGAIPPGTNPDSTLVTLNWHFLRRWSLETTVGDAGTSIIDLVWQHRY